MKKMRDQVLLRTVVGWLVCVLLSFTLYFSLSFMQFRYGELGQFYADTQVMNEDALREKYDDLWDVFKTTWMLTRWVFLPFTSLSVGIVAGLFGVRRAGFLAALGLLPLSLFLLLTGFGSRPMLFISFYFALAFVTAEGAAWIRSTIRSKRRVTSSDAGE